MTILKSNEARRRALRAVQKVEDRITGMLVRYGFELNELEPAKTELVRRLNKLQAISERRGDPYNWRDVDIIIRILSKTRRTMSFDPSTNAAQLAALVARCDAKQFALNIINGTTQINAGHPYQGQFPVNLTLPMTAISWTATYRGIKASQPALIVNTSQSANGQAAVLDAASKVLDGMDLQAARDGANPNPYNPRTGYTGP